MAKTCNGTIVGATSCEWVRGWLPLLTGDAGELPGEQSELSAEERERIEHHLGKCPQCNARRAAFEQVGVILSMAATKPAVAADTPSVWPELEQRLQRHRQRSLSRWLQVREWVWTRASRWVAGRRRGDYGYLRSRSPLPVAWVRDSLDEYLVQRVQPVAFRMSEDLTSTFLRWATPRFCLGAGLATAALVLFLIGVGIAHRRSEAEAQIAANAVPIPGAAIPADEPRDEAEFAMADERADHETQDRIAVAQSEVSEPATATVVQVPATKASAPTSTTTTASTTAPSAPRYDFDLENGTPMPPETRSGKPAY